MSKIIKNIIKFLLVILMFFSVIYIILKVYIYNILNKSYNAYLENNKKDNIHIVVNGIVYENGQKTNTSKSNVYILGKYKKVSNEYEYFQTNSKHIMNRYYDLETYDFIDELIFQVDGMENKTYAIVDGQKDIIGENDSCPQIINTIDYFNADEITLKDKIEIYFNQFNKIKIDFKNDASDEYIVLKLKLEDNAEYIIWIDKESYLVKKIEDKFEYESKTDKGLEKINNIHIMEKQYFYDTVKENDIKWPDLNGKVVKISK